MFFNSRRRGVRGLLVVTIMALVAAVLSLAPSAANATPSSGATVSGHVSLAPSGQSADQYEFFVYYVCNSPEIVGGTCTSTSQSAAVLVGSGGDFTVTGIPDAGHYTFYVYGGGYATAQFNLEITDPTATYSGEDVTLQPLALISGHVDLGSDDAPATAGSVGIQAVQYPDAVSAGYPGSTRSPIFSTTVQSDGSYQLGVAPGFYYRLEFEPIGSSVYPDAWWNNGGPLGDSPRDAFPQYIASGGTTVTADVTIPVGATISGTLTGGTFGSGTQIVVYDSTDGRHAPGYGYEYQFNAGAGSVSLGPLLPGSYYVIANPDQEQPYLVPTDDDAYQPREFDLSAGDGISGVSIQLGRPTQVQPGAICADCGDIDPSGLIELQWDNPITEQWETVPPNPNTVLGTFPNGGVSDLIPGTYRFIAFSPFGGMTYGDAFDVSDGAQLTVPFSFSIAPRSVTLAQQLLRLSLNEDLLGPGSGAYGWVYLQSDSGAIVDSATPTSVSVSGSIVASSTAPVFPRPWYLDPLG